MSEAATAVKPRAGRYYTDGKALVWCERVRQGIAICEDCSSGAAVELTAEDMGGWRTVVKEDLDGIKA